MNYLKSSILSFLILISLNFFSKEIELMPNIKKVTVFSLGAEVTHQLNVSIPSGQNVLKLKAVSPHTITKTIQIVDENITVINAKLIKKLTDSELQELLDKKDACQKQIEALNQNLNNSSKSGATDFASLLRFYDTKILSLKKKMRILSEKIEKDSLNAGEPYLEILVSTSKKINRKIDLKYVVGSAAWVPKYEIFVEDIKQNLKLKYIAKIMNSTGEDWKNVELQLSLNSPFDKTGTIPEVEPFYLGGSSPSRNNQNEGSKVDDSENLDQLKIEGVEYIEYDAPPFTDVIKIEGTKTIPANGGIYAYDVFLKELNTNYVWYAFPGYEENPYLIGQVTGWDSLPLINGDAQVFLKGTNIGSSVISLEGFPDTLDIPIGQNKEVIVERKVIGNESFVKTKNSKTIETVAFSYSIINTRNEEVSLIVFDQTPISQSNKIDVEIHNKSKADYLDESGILIWRFNQLTSKKKENFKLVYTVEYDKYQYGRSRGKSNFYRSQTGWSFGKKKKRRSLAKF